MKKTRGVYKRSSILYIGYRNEKGRIVRESTGQTSLKLAEQILASARLK